MDARRSQFDLDYTAELISGVCRPKFVEIGTSVEQPSVVNQFFLELRYFAAFGRESRKGTGGVKKYAKFRHFFGPPCSLRRARNKLI